MGFVMNLKTYRERIGQYYGEEASWKILLIKSMILVYRPLGYMGIKFPLPVAVIAGSRQEAQQFPYVARGCCPAAYGATNVSDRDFKSLMDGYHSEALCMQYLKSKNTEPCLENLVGICETGLYGNRRFYDPIFVTFAEGIPLGVAENFMGKIRLDGGICPMAGGGMPEAEESFTRLMIGQIKENGPIVRERILELSSGEEFQNLSRNSPGAEVWLAVEIILEGLIKRANAPGSEKQDCLEKIRMAQKQIREGWDIEQIAGDLCEIFRNMLFWASPNIPDMIDKRKAKAEDIEDSREQPFYDENFYYVPEGLFERIISMAGGDMSVKEMKEALAEQKMLKTEGEKRKYYTINTDFFLEEGKVKKRMVWLYRDKVDLPFQVTWEQDIQIKKRGKIQP